ncbi:hypothetical protein A5661_03595 [Mycobacterium asiaticum]|nr:hypothetical protein A5661_03595 [Mycobacterium asiaticum]
MAYGLQQAIAVMQYNVAFMNLIHCVPVILRSPRLIQHWRPKEPAITLFRISLVLIHPPDRSLWSEKTDPLLGELTISIDETAFTQEFSVAGTLRFEGSVLLPLVGVRTLRQSAA